MKLMLTTDLLRAGDRVFCHGAVVRLQGEPFTYPGHEGRTVYRWSDQPIISGKVATFEHLTVWTVQGNDTAHWCVERADPDASA